MLIRAVLAAAAIAAALAPAASAADLKADFFDVHAVATGTPPSAVATSGGQVRLSVACATADPQANSVAAYLYKCSVGPVAASTYCGWECFGPPFAAATGTAPQARYELCVGAAAIGQLSKNFHKCVPLDPTTNTAVITR